MKMQITPEWLYSKLDDDIEEPGGIMACSPFMYAWMITDEYAKMNATVKYIINLSLVEYTRDREHLGDSDDRFIWMMDRAARYAKRLIRKARNGDPNVTTENQ